MSDIQTDLVRNGLTPDGVLAKPRVSAEHFRNLAARLKSGPVVVPDLKPVAVPPATVVVAPAVVVETPAVIETVAAVFETLPVIETVAAVIETPPVVETVAPIITTPPVIEPEAAVIETLPVVEAERFPAFVEDGPVIEAIAPAHLEDIDLPIEPVQAAPDVLPELDGNFSDNFTYVPEPGEVQAEAQPDDVDPTSAQELAERAIQLELENIWRMLLAKPTADDRSQYLREAAAYKDGDDELEPVAPELDLSRIQPANLDEDIDVAGIVNSAVTPDALAATGGQDLPELMRSLLDIMAAGNAAGQPQERALAADTLLRLVARLDLKSLVLLAGRLAMMDQPPHLLVARLIRDPRVEVAGPLLEDCAQLSDKDLVSVVQEGEPAKLRMMARRRHLTRAISDLLIQSGDPSVVLTLVRNMDAEISHDGFQSLLQLCENHAELLAPLATRADLQAPMAFELFWVAPPQLRRFILSRFLTDSEMLTKILKITMATKTDEEGELEPMSQHALIESLERAARGHVDQAAEELSALMHVSPATMTRILGDVQGEAVVVMLKAAGYPRSAVVGLLKKMQDADLPLVSRERDAEELQVMFDTLSFNKARTLLTYWDWAQGKTGPYAPVQ
jgi:Uncharacterised protein conserved in bacteria (DUF2336)